jgi:primosomal protein N' (replication factor Y)
MSQNPSYAEVALPLPVEGSFTYDIPPSMATMIRPGMRAIVQFGKKKIFTGLVLRVHSEPPVTHALKPLADLPDDHPIVLGSQLEFWHWMSRYYMASLGSVFKAAVPAGLRPESESRITLAPNGAVDRLSLTEKKIMNALEGHEPITVHELSRRSGIQNPLPSLYGLIQKGSVELEETLSETYKPKQEAFLFPYRELGDAAYQEILDALMKAPKQKATLESFIFHWNQRSQKKEGIPLSIIKSDPHATASSIEALIKKKILVKKNVEVGRLSFQPTPTEELKLLSDEQDQALKSIREQFEYKNAVLLHGVTSSGKTEIYAHLIRQQMDLGHQVLYLLPEIALTSQIIIRLKKYFGHRIGVYHSRYSDAERVEIWRNLLDKNPENQYQVILGVRSSVFLPFRNLGLIIVDEEQEPSYKQQDPAPRYHARDAALYLGRLLQAKVLLGTATPSLESFYNADSGKFGYVPLKQRFGNIQMPEITLANTQEAWKKKKMVAHFTPELHTRIIDALNDSDQVILFQNRRGFSPYLQCQQCGWIPNCKNCDVHLTYHKHTQNLKCHYCGYTSAVPSSCAHCSVTDIKTRGMGTEKVEEEVGILFPGARIKRMDLDTTRSKRAYHKILSDLENHKIDILIGTQMVSKGLDFEKVRLVGVLNADNLLFFPDFRSYERTYQLLAQVSGRAGRKDRRGTVVIQTSDPRHPVIKWVVQDAYLDMYNDQLSERKRFKYPPFYRLIKITLKHRNRNLLNAAAALMVRELRSDFKDRVLGPEFPLISRIQRWHLKVMYVKLERNLSIKEAKEHLAGHLTRMEATSSFKGVQIVIDVDPM